ncbi:hypothetical protein OH77DRAFT_1386841, partial [Trametes cingulata]
DDETSSDEESFVDEDGDSYTLDHVLGLLSVREGSEEDAERMEKKVFWKVRRMLEAQSPELSSVRAGPCTIMAGSSVEFPRSTPGTVSRTFLLRDAKVFNRAGGCSGHVIVKVIPYTRENYRRFEQLEDDSIREVSVASVQIDDAPVSHGAVTLMRPAVPTPPPVVSLRTWLCGYNVPFLIDTGSQIDCIHANMWRSIGTTHSLVRTNNRLVNVTGTRLRCLGVWKVMITVGTITSPIDLHVVESLTAPGILGRPWQEHNQMWMDHTLDGVQVGIRSRDGFHTYSVLVTSLQTQRAAWSQAMRVCGAVTEEDMPVIDFGDTDRIQELMQTAEDLDEVDVTRDPWNIRIDEVTQQLEPEEGPSEVNVENRMYEELLRRYREGHLLPRTAYQPWMESVAPYETDRLTLSDAMRIGLSEKEDLFLLRNAMVRLDGTYHEGHGILHMLYFPHTSQRV